MYYLLTRPHHHPTLNSDGTLFFSGHVNPAACANVSIVAKRGWRPEIRRSRTLSLVVKGENGEVAPRMTAEDALAIVRQSCVWKDIANVELVRVATTNGKATHVFVQFEGEIMARSYINKVDALLYTQQSSGRRFFVHGSQLNAYYEYEAQPGGAFDSLVWRNPEYKGLRSATIHIRGNAGSRKVDTHNISDDVLVDMLERSLKGRMSMVESVRRVDMEAKGIALVVCARGDVELLCSILQGAVGTRVGRLAVCEVTVGQSRAGDSEVCDRVVCSNALRIEQCESVEEDVASVSLASTPTHVGSPNTSDWSRSPGMTATSSATLGSGLWQSKLTRPSPMIVPVLNTDDDSMMGSPHELDRSLGNTDSCASSASLKATEVESLISPRDATGYDDELCAYFFN